MSYRHGRACHGTAKVEDCGRTGVHQTGNSLQRRGFFAGDDSPIRMTQQTSFDDLSSFGADDASDDRPDAEAAAVAGQSGSHVSEVVDSQDIKVPDRDGEQSVEMMVTAVDYTVEGRGSDEYPVVHVFGRTPENELEHVRVVGTEPYFYVPTADIEDRNLVDEYDVILDTREYPHGDEDEERFESIRGETVTKVIARTPRDVGNIRDDFETTYEADILFPNRFLIDHGITSGMVVEERRLEEPVHGEDPELQVTSEHIQPAEVDADLRVNTFDIEVDDRNGFPEDGEEPIICLTSHDSYDDEYVLWLYDAPVGKGKDVPDEELLTAFEQYEFISAESDVRLERFDDEAAMLDAFLTYLSDTNPDLTTGWNFEDFDAPYLFDRMEELNPTTKYDLSPDRASRVDETWRSGWGGPDVKGRVVFDLLYAYQRNQFSELDSYRLDAVAELELGVGKERYTGDIGDLWEQDPTRLLEYNLRDVELCVEIDRQQNLIDFWDDTRKFVGCQLEDAPTPGDVVDMYVLHKAYGTFVLPTKGQQEGEDFEGGAVFEPITGVKENVSVLDLKCFSEDTEVVTPSGVRNIAEIEEGDEIYTLNRDSLECEVKPVTETHQYENKYGELHHLSGNTHDLKITENHRLMVSDSRDWDDQQPDDFEMMEYRDIPDDERYAFPQHEPVSGRSPDEFDLADAVSDSSVSVYSESLTAFRNAVPEEVVEELDDAQGTSEKLATQKRVTKYLVPLETYLEHRDAIETAADETFLKYGRGHTELPTTVPMEKWLELIGWYVTEGSLSQETGRITIHQSDESNRSDICQLLDELDIQYNVDARGVNVSNQMLVHWFEAQCGDAAANKRLPDWTFELDGTLLRTLLDTLIRGDGTRAESGLGKFWTKSDQLKEDFVDLAVRCGEKPSVAREDGDMWYVSAGKRGSFKKETNATVEEHDGDVYCVTAEDNHVVLAGRNGNFQWVGQSLYPMCMVTINASPETIVDNPEEYSDETYVAPNGIRFRKEPDGMMREMVDELLTEREELKEQRNQHDPESQDYGRFDRQQASVKVIMNCFTPDTDVLTPDGVRSITNLDVGDEVYSLDPETMKMEVKPVEETHEYPDYRDELIDIETDKIDLRVTPNHRMLVRKAETNGITWDEDDYRFVEAEELDDATNYQLPHGWNGPGGTRLETVDLTQYVEGEYQVWADNDVHGHTLASEIGYYPDKIQKADRDTTGYVFSQAEFDEHRSYLEEVCTEFLVHREANRKWVPMRYDGDDFLELLAWYITEGSVYTSETKEFGEKLRGSATSVQIAQDAPTATDGGVGVETADSTHSQIRDLLDRMGFDYYVDENGYQFTSRLWGEFLERTCGENSFEKQIPEFVFETSREQKREFLETLIAGDGDWQKNSWRYSTASETLRDDVLRLCTHLGLTANYSEDDGGTFRIYVTEDSQNTLRMHRSSSRSTAKNGVYCVTVADNHTLLAGRNGKFQFVGQSLYGVSGWEQFRLYDKDNAAAITAMGRRVIEFTEEAANELDYNVTYGDTDSVMLSLSDISAENVTVPDDIREAHPEMGETELETLVAALDASEEIEEHINERYDEFADEELDAQEHRFQIEFEKLYRRFFQAGKKKRYAGHIVWKEGKHVDDIDITGFEYTRSDIAPITKRVQKRVIEMIVDTTASEEEIKEDLRDYLRDVIEKFEEGEIDLEDIGIPGGIGQKLDSYDTKTAHVRGAKYANVLLGTNFGNGSKPIRLYLEQVDPSYFESLETERPEIASEPDYREFKRNPDVICFDYAEQIPEEFDVNYEKMLEKTLEGPISRVIESLGLSWEEIKEGEQQTGLGQYM
jgi:DNA polymerase I